MTSHTDSDTGTKSDTGTNADMTNTATLQTLAASGDQPGWRVLDTARVQHFTGEITFQVQPPISVYFDDGVAYHAVRVGDPSLCARLVELHVVEPAQIERGVVRVGNVENLGRLFDRDPSIDRDAVMVVLELSTNDVVTTIANTVSGPFTLTAYRHHVSGVHRWFVPPGGSGEQRAQLIPVGEVAQIDGSVTNHLPGLAEPGLAAPGFADPADDGVHIVWDQPLGGAPEPGHVTNDDLLSRLIGDLDRPASMGEPSSDPTPIGEPPPVFAPVADAAPAPASVFDVVPVVDSAPTGPGGAARAEDDYQILWPDGSEQQLTEIETESMPIPPISLPSATVIDIQATPWEISIEDLAAAAAADDFDQAAADVAMKTPNDPMAVAAEAPRATVFDMPRLVFTADNVPVEQQPEAVVDAVRRALDAIEVASNCPTHLPSVEVGSLPAFRRTTPLQCDAADRSAHGNSVASEAPSSVAPNAAPARVGGFAPPTFNDRAEAVYARAAAAEQSIVGPAPGVATIVFRDQVADEGRDRSSALKRLIGSLRRR